MAVLAGSDPPTCCPPSTLRRPLSAAGVRPWEVHPAGGKGDERRVGEPTVGEEAGRVGVRAPHPRARRDAPALRLALTERPQA